MASINARHRIPYVDGLRGYLIFSMTLSHMGFLGSNLFTHLSHKSVSVFFTGEGFMTISGLMCGYIMLDVVKDQGLARGLLNSVRRSWKIMRYYVAVFLLCVVPLVFVSLSENALLGEYFRGRDPASLQSFAMFVGSLYRPLMYDILYLYVILIGTAPLVLWAALRWGGHSVLGASAFLWLCVQYGLVEKFVSKAGGALGYKTEGLFGSFSIFAWQFPFIIGLLIGADVAQNFAAWPQRLKWLRRHVMPVAFGLCTAFALFRFATLAGVLGIGAEFFMAYLTLSPLTLLNFFSFSIVLVCVLSSDASDPNPVVRWAKSGLHLLLKTLVLRAIGRNTLLTFSASVVLTYWVIALKPWLNLLGATFWVNTLVFVAVMALIYAAVWADQRVRGKARA